MEGHESSWLLATGVGAIHTCRWSKALKVAALESRKFRRLVCRPGQEPMNQRKTGVEHRDAPSREARETGASQWRTGQPGATRKDIEWSAQREQGRRERRMRERAMRKRVATPAGSLLLGGRGRPNPAALCRSTEATGHMAGLVQWCGQMAQGPAGNSGRGGCLR